MGQSSAGGASAGLPNTAPTAGLQAMFANNQATQRNQAAQLTQPQQYQMPAAQQQQMQTAMSSASKPPPFRATTAAQYNPGDAQAKGRGFQTAQSEQDFLKTLTNQQQGLYSQPDIRQSGSSIWSPTNAPYHVQDPSIMQAQTIWNLKQQYPDLFGGAGQNQQAPQTSMAQQLASQMNQR